MSMSTLLRMHDGEKRPTLYNIPSFAFLAGVATSNGTSHLSEPGASLLPTTLI